MIVQGYATPLLHVGVVDQSAVAFNTTYGSSNLNFSWDIIARAAGVSIAKPSDTTCVAQLFSVCTLSPQGRCLCLASSTRTIGVRTGQCEAGAVSC